MKKLFFLFAMLFCITTTFAQAEINTAPESMGFFETLFSVFVPGILSMSLVLFADAKRYYDTDEWSWGIFLDTKLKPALFTILLSIAVYILLVYVPILEPYLNMLAGSTSIPLTSAALFGAASAMIDGFTKNKK